MSGLKVVFEDPGFCVECGGRIIYDGNGELVCSSCGLVHGYVYDAPFYERRGDVKRGVNTEHYFPVRRIDVRDYAESFLVAVCLRRLKLPITATVTALNVLRKIRKQRKAVKHWVAAAIYAACRAHGIPVNLRELKEAVIGKTRVHGITWLMLEAMKHVKDKPVDLKKKTMKYAEKTCRNLGLKNESLALAMEIIGKYRGSISPKSLAAAATYTAALVYEGRRITQEEIAEVAGVTDVTLRKWFHKIAKCLTIEVYL